MIDDIVEMVLKEARARDRHNMFLSVFSVLEEIVDIIYPRIFVDRIAERRKKYFENKQETETEESGP